jgi:hypothetical protein
LDIRFVLPPKDYKKTFRKNRFCNVIEATLSFKDKWNYHWDYIQHNLLAVAMLKSIPNAKKLHLKSDTLLNWKTLNVISSNCKELEFLTLEGEMGLCNSDICKGLQNLRFIHFKGCEMVLKGAKDLLLQSQQLQAILNGLELMVRSTAQMSVVSGFLKETKMIEEEGYEDNDYIDESDSIFSTIYFV